MKRQLVRLIILSLCLICGWAFSYLRLPYVGAKHGYWMGYLAALGSLAFIIGLLWAWNKNLSLRKLIGKGSIENSPKKVSKTQKRIWLITTLLIFVLAAFLIIRSDSKIGKLESQIEQLNEKYAQKEMQNISMREGNEGKLVESVLYKITNEIKSDSSLSEETIKSIISLSKSFKPYNLMEDDTTVLSPGRGYLLRSLVFMNIDSSAYSKIMTMSDFSYADLRDADFSNKNLKNIKLVRANLANAILDKANLSAANLTEADLHNCSMKKTIAESTIFRRANLNWSTLNKAQLLDCNMNGVQLNNATCLKTNFSNSTFQWSSLNNSMFEKANVTNCDFLKTSFVRSNLNKANMHTTYVRTADFTEATLLDAKIDSLKVEEDWLTKIEDWKMEGREKVSELYQIVDVSENPEKPDFRLVKK